MFDFGLWTVIWDTHSRLDELPGTLGIGFEVWDVQRLLKLPCTNLEGTMRVVTEIMKTERSCQGECAILWMCRG